MVKSLKSRRHRLSTRRSTRLSTRRSTRRNVRKNRKSMRRMRTRGGGLSNVLPVTTWGKWDSLPGSTLWSPSQQAPAPLANGGLYTGSQSTGSWASSPFPATQYAMSVEAARTANNPVVFYQQRPDPMAGSSWSPYVGQSISPDHWSARLPKGIGAYE